MISPSLRECQFVTSHVARFKRERVLRWFQGLASLWCLWVFGKGYCYAVDVGSEIFSIAQMFLRGWREQI